MAESKLTLPSKMKQMAIETNETIGAKPSLVFATCCAPCAIYGHQGAEGNDCLISVLLCLFCWPGACIHGALWASRDDAASAVGTPFVAVMNR